MSRFKTDAANKGAVDKCSPVYCLDKELMQGRSCLYAKYANTVPEFLAVKMIILYLTGYSTKEEFSELI